MKIIIAGGSGFLGKSLANHFQNHEIWILTRNPKRPNEIFWDAQNLGKWSESLENADVLINMTGKSVDCRYNYKNRAEILRSRIDSTNILQMAVDNCKNPPKIWLNSSSATIYVHAETQLMTEANGVIGDDFSMNICKSWEKAFFATTSPQTRKVALRTAIVLGKEGEALKKLKTITQLGLGGKQGSGRQKMSWIHVEDFCRAVEFIIQNESIIGAINISAPNPIDNQDFMAILRKNVNVSFGIPSPIFLLEIGTLLLQTETELLLKSRNVYPERLLNYGFQFRFETVENALRELVG
ncbi:MAG: TIGR01777 family oxidoreductase [Bacteroidota bacterium]